LFEIFQSNYAYAQDADFSYGPPRTNRMYDMPPSTSNTFGGGIGHFPASSTSSLSGGNCNASNAGTNLIVNYLPQDMNERELHTVFSTMGPIESCRVLRDFKVSG
jgi:protein sex-lethal